MKSFLFLIVAALILSSCDFVGFTKPVPKEGNNLSEFPKILQGKYLVTKNVFMDPDTSSPDSIFIGEKYMFYNSKKAKDNKPVYLSDTSAVLKKFEDYYVYNFKNENYWGVYLIQNQKDKALKVFSIYTLDKDLTSFYKGLNEITPLEKNKKVKSITEYFITPTDKQLKSIIEHHYFKEMLILSKIK